MYGSTPKLLRVSSHQRAFPNRVKYNTLLDALLSYFLPLFNVLFESGRMIKYRRVVGSMFSKPFLAKSTIAPRIGKDFEEPASFLYGT